MGVGIDLPIPFGWFAVAYSKDLEPGDVVPTFLFDQHQVLFRTESGDARMIDAFCPHLGAHLGEGETFGLQQLTDSFDFLFENTEAPDVMLLLETTAGQGTNLGYRFEHLRDVIGMSK